MKSHFFIHIPKTGGTAIRLFTFLEPMIQDATPEFHVSTDYTHNLHDQMKKFKEHHGNEHARFIDLNQEKIKDMKKFAIVRNPWDRVVSRYFFAKQLINQGKTEPSYVDISSFEAFLEERWKWGDVPYFWHRAIRGWYPSVDYVVDNNGKIAVDVLRFENYDEDVGSYFDLSISVPKRNVSIKTTTYKDIYTPETIKIVADWYAKDIDTFGYDFDTGPTKNVWALK